MVMTIIASFLYDTHILFLFVNIHVSIILILLRKPMLQDMLLEYG